jgi:CDP-diacylglycerol--glycerol-3-phosphate 3-phosphatidyltransferase
MSKFYKDLPNQLTTIRLWSIPFMVLFVLFFNEHLISRFIGTVLFIIVAFTDYFDGYFARKYGAESDFGKCFDNIADKAFIVSLLFVLVSQKRADVLPCIAIALREIVISGVREFLGNKQITLNVSILAKWKTTLQLIAIGILLASKPNTILANIGMSVLWFSAIITLITMRDYIKNVTKYFN